MKQVQITERIYVDARGRRVSPDFKGEKTLAAAPGDELSEERAAELGVKSAPKPEDKGRRPGDDKARQPGDDKSAQKS